MDAPVTSDMKRNRSVEGSLVFSFVLARPVGRSTDEDQRNVKF